MCAFRSARPPRCGHVVVDVPVLFRRRRAGFHALLRAKYNSCFFLRRGRGGTTVMHARARRRERERQMFSCIDA
jgi:hypothetical protein